MKRAIVFVGLILSSATSFAGGLVTDIHATSVGQLILIRPEGQLVGVIDAEGKYFLLQQERSSIKVANALCDWKKAWTATENTIHCLAK